MKEAKFEIGQMVWSPAAGFCTIDEVSADKEDYFPVIAGGESFTVSGKLYPEDKHRTLLTVEEAKLLGLEPPALPKVKKTIQIWVNLYKGANSSESFSSEDIADRFTPRDRIGGKAWPCEVSYEE